MGFIDKRKRLMKNRGCSMPKLKFNFKRMRARHTRNPLAQFTERK